LSRGAARGFNLQIRCILKPVYCSDCFRTMRARQTFPQKLSSTPLGTRIAPEKDPRNQSQ